MRKLVLVLALVCSIGWVSAGAIKLDVGSTNTSSQVEPGWYQFLNTDNGVTLYNGVKVTLTSSGALTYRYRTQTNYSGVPNEQLWRDFVYAPADSDITMMIENLAPNCPYEISIGAFDMSSNTATPRAADWKVNGVTILTTSFGIPGVPIATLMPSAERNYMMTGAAVSDATGKIILQSAKALPPTGNGTPHAFINGIIINQQVWATNPSPANAATQVPSDAVLSWTTGIDPNNPAQPNPRIRAHYLYVTDANDFTGVSPIQIPAGNPVAATASYDQLTFGMDKAYRWRVDEAVDNGSGGFSAPGDPATIVGKVWTFEAIKSFAVISSQPANLKAASGSTAEFTVTFTSFSPAFAAWSKDGLPVAGGGDITVTDTETSSTLSIASAEVADEGAYSCTITNDAGPVSSESALLAVKRLLAHYPFEQNGDDVVGAADGTPVNGVTYSAGVVTSGGQAWAADPNGGNYFEVPAAAAYPRAGFGKGLEEFTYSYWVKQGTYSGDARIFGVFNREGVDMVEFKNTAVQMNVSGTGSLGCYIRQENNQFRELNTAAATIASDQWYLVTFTSKDSIVKCFVNGDFREQRDYTAFEPMVNFVDWQYPMTLMARNVRGVIGEFYPGEADDLRIYNYAFSDEEVAQLYYDQTGIRPCIYEGSLTYDFTDDCQINMDDFAMFAAEWLKSGLFVPQD